LKNKKAGILNKNITIFLRPFLKEKRDSSISKPCAAYWNVKEKKLFSCIFEQNQFNAKVIVVGFIRKKYTAKLHQ
jgi:hypothetical protein